MTDLYLFAEEIAFKKYHIRATAKPLAGDEDSNFLLKSEKGEQYLLKIASEHKDVSNIVFQNELLQHLATKKLESCVPKILRNIDGDFVTTETYKNQKNFVAKLFISYTTPSFTFSSGRISINFEDAKL